ncbi:2-keto-4-pentenoate hydratase [Streptomyces sp. NBC_01506]|uniref:2-keto-4-pentenoate hydratase n=1 Tax=Streptomyces sp. NBC_01506 TaxID=2903887 RepID=UPI003863075B
MTPSSHTDSDSDSDSDTAATATTAQASLRLAAARASHRPCPPVRDLLPPGDVDTAYAVQSTWVAERVAAGARVIGRKIGLTSPTVQAQLGVDRPDFGFLLDDMACRDGAPVEMGRLLQPKIEAEVAFVLAADLDTEFIGAAEVAEATGQVVAALEIVDSRIADWDISLVDTVADNASSGLFVLGSRPRPLDGLDLTGCAMVLRRGDEVVSTGTGAECLGGPTRAVAWLARTAHAHGRPLRAGDIVLSGALGPMVPVAAGDVFEAEISGLGTVRTSFTGTGGAS